MKKHILLVFIAAVYFFSSCSNNNDLPFHVEDTIGEHFITMKLDVCIEAFVGETTKAVDDTKWNDNDTIYLKFETEQGWVSGIGNYVETNDEWQVNYNGALDVNKLSKVQITFLGNAPCSDGNNVELSSKYPVYQDTDGTYLYNQIEAGSELETSERYLCVKGILKPMTSRVMFDKTTNINGTWVKIDEEYVLCGLEYYTNYNISTGELKKEKGFISGKRSYERRDDMAQLVCDGWRYVLLPEDSRNFTILKYADIDNCWDCAYTTTCPSNMFVIGHSGKMNLPQYSSHNGWTAKQVNGEDNGRMWMDLGLPSGNKWSFENLGGSLIMFQGYGDIENIYGGCYQWGETSQETFSSVITDISGTSYDTAAYLWGGNWVMPNSDDFRELFDYCTFKYVSNIYENESGYLIIGPNSLDIYLTMAGQKFEDGYRSLSNGFYWTSTTYSSDNASFLWLTDENVKISSNPKNSRYSIRPIIRGEK